jgi:aspartate carbamoyltransferase catalytic subunit
MDILSCDQFSIQQLNEIFLLADDIQKNPKKYRHILDDKIIATIFYEPSTRTRLSFESAVQRLGGKIISTENAQEMSSAIKGETLSDTIRVLTGYCDGIVLRHFDNDSADIAASVADIPVINAGSGSGEHPTQALLDLYTIYQKKNKLNNLKIAFIGDLSHGRTVHSLIKLLTKYENNTVYGLSQPELALPEKYLQTFTKNNQYIPVNTLDDLPKDLDVIYQTRNQVERFKENHANTAEFVIDNAYLNTFSIDTMLMHPLPRIAEINPNCDENPRAYYFKQAHNGVFIRMALLVYLFQ